MKKDNKRKGNEKGEEHRPPKFLDFPITFLREGFNTDVIVNKIIPVCAHQYIQKLLDIMDTSDDVILDAVARDFKLPERLMLHYLEQLEEDGEERGIATGRELIQEAKETRAAWTNLPIQVVSLYYDKNPSPEMELMIICYAAYKSIYGTGKRKSVVTTNEMVKARMAGYNSPRDVVLPDRIKNLSKYQMSNLRMRIHDLFGDFVFNVWGVRGILFGFNIDPVDLCTDYLLSKDKESVKDTQASAMAEARKRIKERKEGPTDEPDEEPLPF